MIYKLTILPYVEYVGFLVVACTVDDRRSLQKCQNDALRICTKCKIADQVCIEELHSKCKIVWNSVDVISYYY